MNILFEEDGSFRAGTMLADNNTSLQVELPSGKRSKVKAANVLLRFAAPAPAELMQRAERDATEIATDFLWEVSPENEFSFDELAADYFGAKPDAVQAATVLMRLHAAPIYFHRKGKGRYRKAPAEILQAALAGIEKKRLTQLAIDSMTAQLISGNLPVELSSMLNPLLYAPDRNRSETKALEAACAATGKSPAQLLHACGALPSTHDFHFGRFLHEYFPAARGGVNFPAYTSAEIPANLPVADVRAFSIDDAATTEIDDAFSVTPHANGWRIGIHIAAPGLGFSPESALGKIARDRLSTVYMPGQKITMLPTAVVEQFTLAAGATVPAISLYLELATDLRILSQHSCIEQIHIAANLRHHDIEPVFNEETLATGLSEFAYRDELKLLWELATVLEAGRGEIRRATQRKDYNFNVDWAASSPNVASESGVISISERQRGSPLDTLVAELMIVANSSWGALLRDAGVPALYRAQSAGKVRMTTVAAAHEGLGVDCYAWSSSPLRRYCDLLNQWQLIAHLQGNPPPFRAKSTELLAAMRDFDLTYSAYADFQRGMERYWCLRWLQQEACHQVTARVIKEQLVRLEDVPLVMRLLDLPPAEVASPGRRVLLAIDRIDLLGAEIHASFIELVQGQTDTALDAEELDESELAAEMVTELEIELNPEIVTESRSDSAIASTGETPAAD